MNVFRRKELTKTQRNHDADAIHERAKHMPRNGNKIVPAPSSMGHMLTSHEIIRQSIYHHIGCF